MSRQGCSSCLPAWRRSGTASLLCLAISLPGLAAASSVSPLEIMVEDAASPWSNADGSGYANDVVKAAFNAAGVIVKLDVVPYARCKAMAVAGKVAGCFSMSWEPTLQGLIVFADQPIFTAHARFYHNTARPLAVTRQEDIASGTVIGIVNGYEYPQSLDALRKKGVLFDASDSETILLKKLANGRLDLAILMLDGLKTDVALMTEAGVNNVSFAFPSGEMASFVGFSAHHPSGDYARSKFNEGYAQIERNGTLNSIKSNWHLKF